LKKYSYYLVATIHRPKFEEGFKNFRTSDGLVIQVFSSQTNCSNPTGVMPIIPNVTLKLLNALGGKLDNNLNELHIFSAINS
jgi:hypothetical protein